MRTSEQTSRTEMARIRGQIMRTDPADVRRRVLLVCAHERARRRSKLDSPPASSMRVEPMVRHVGNRRREVSEYAAMVPRICARADAVIREDARVLVVSRGDDALLEIGARKVGHFPQARDQWAGYYPADGADAIVHLEALAADGYDHIVFPATTFWWFEYYEGLASRLLVRGRAVWHDDDCAIFALAAEESP